MSETKKDFYNIVAMSEAFRKYDKSLDDGGTLSQFDLLRWQARFQLAIAQQLAAISSHLSKIVGKAEQLNDQNSDGSSS